MSRETICPLCGFEFPSLLSLTNHRCHIREEPRDDQGDARSYRSQQESDLQNARDLKR